MPFSFRTQLLIFHYTKFNEQQAHFFTYRLFMKMLSQTPSFDREVITQYVSPCLNLQCGNLLIKAPIII